jgi:hypothetical protein
MHQAPGEDDIYCDIVIETIQTDFLSLISSAEAGN